MAARVPGEALDLAPRDASPVGPVTRGAELAGALPAPQGVGAHADRAGGVAEQKAFLAGHACLSIA
jgi:hypothetical protein